MRTAPGAAILMVVLAAGCGHDLRNGLFELRQAGPALLDTCGQLPADGLLLDASLTTSGEEVRLDLYLFGPSGPIALIGRFKEAVTGERDEFSADGSIGRVTVPVGDVDCVVRFGQVHLEAVIDGDEAFEGTLQIGMDLAPNQDPRCPLRCDLSVPYRAEHT